jgi:hypothetical protein
MSCTLISNGVDARVGLLRACHLDEVLLHVEYEVPDEVRWAPQNGGRFHDASIAENQWLGKDLDLARLRPRIVGTVG